MGSSVFAVKDFYFVLCQLALPSAETNVACSQSMAKRLYSIEGL